ncbi:MAG: Fe-S cluster assembly protein SufD [Actinomycetota bacterium]|jgi:Fe-S cluster assembly protein SufD|nr:Fe-S cluster assembly protein SufD [Actinomycetota bacterium]
MPHPTEAEEIWRYSRIDDLDLERFSPGTVAGGDVAPSFDELLGAIGPRAATIISVDGRATLTEVDPGLAAKGVTIGSASQLPDGGGSFGTVATAVDRFSELNTAFAAEPLAIRVPRGVVIELPIVVLHHITGDGAAVFPRTLIEAGEASQVTVVEHLSSSDVAALVVQVSEIDAAQAANVRHLTVQQLGTRVWHIAYAASRVGRDATLQSAAVSLGGEYARVRTASLLDGQGATSNLLAVYFGDEHQMHDFRTLQDHDAPKTTSDLLFKGAVEDDAHAVYSGLIRVRKGAKGTNAFQTNRNLVLSDGAHADSVPNLEILENDVKCSHASAVGPIDADQRYYLESRGVPPQVAERLIVLGFFDEILERTPVAGLRPLLRDAVATKLDKVLS